MKNTMKKTLSLLLALTMVLSLGLPAYAVGTTDEDEIISAEEPALQPIAAGKITDFGDDEIISEDQINILGDLEDLTVEEIEFAPAQDFSFSDELNGFAVEVSAPAGALPLGTEMIVNRLVDLTPVQNAVDSAEDLNGRVRLAADISFWLEGKEVEPAEGTKLVVRMSAPEIEDVVEPVVIHIPDGENAAPEIVEQLRSGDVVMADTIAFEAGSFSVYAILDDGSTVIPGQEHRLTYEFYNSDGTPYVFKDVTGADQTTQIIKNGEALEDVGIPTIGASQNAKFVGWYVWNGESATDENGTYGEPVVLGQTITGITEDNTIMLKAKMQGIVNVYFVTAVMKDETGANMARSIVTVQQVEFTAGQTDPITINVSGITTDAPTTDQAVIGWNRDEDAANGVEDDPTTPADEYVAGVAEGTNGVITLYPNGNGEIVDVMMFPAITRAAWVFFHENDGGTGGGASYTPPVFVQVGGKATEPTAPHRTGYTFGGWYKDEACTQAFNFNTPIYTTTHLYAKWTGSATTYSIVVWVQRTSDSARLTSASNLPDDGNNKKTYDFYRAYTVNANTGDEVYVPTNHASRNLGTTLDADGHIRFNRSDANDASHTKTVAGNGSTVLNVYYDRDVMTINWYNGSGYYASITDTWYGLYNATFAEANKTWKSGNWESDRYPISVMDSFVDFDTKQATVLNLYPASVSGNYHLYFYKENLNGGWDQVYDRRMGGSTTVTLAEKYRPGFDLDRYVRNSSNSYPNNATWSTATAGNTINNNNNNVHVRYVRKSFDIEYHNGTKNTEGTTVRTDSLKYETSLAGHTNPTVTYPVAADADHYQFIGWFADSSWTTMVTFTELSAEQKQNYTDWYGISTFVVYDKMPAHNFALYAGYALKGWDCALNPNGGTFTNSNQAGVFWLDYGQFFSSDLKKNIVREGYSFQGWMVATVPFKADGENLDLLDIYTDANNHRFVGDYSNWTMTDSPWEFSTPISGATALMAKWFYLDTMSVVYDAGAGSNAPEDNGAYSDHATTVAFRAPTPPENKFFIGWDIVGTETEEKLVPGTTFEVSSDYATNGVVTLVAVYSSSTNPDDPVPATHISWYANNKTTAQYPKRDAITFLPLEPEEQVTEPTHSIDFPLQLNQDTPIHSATEFTNFGYTFLGWAKLHKDGDQLKDHNGNAVAAPTDDASMDYALTADNLYLKYEGGKFWVNVNGQWKETSYVAADENKPYDDMYAVWEKAYFYVYYTGSNVVEKHKVEEAKKNGEIVGFDLTADLGEGKLYGGYYKDYAGKPDSFDPATLPYDENGKATVGGTTYNGSNVVWAATDAYTKGAEGFPGTGLAMIPEAGLVYYVKEVPADSFLRHTMKFTYRVASGKVGTAWLFTNSDDDNYSEIGFVVSDNGTTKYSGGNTSYISRITITPLSNTSAAATYVTSNDVTKASDEKTIFSAGKYMTYKLVYTNKDVVAPEGTTFQFLDENILENGYSVLNYWITPDGLMVTCTQLRTYGFGDVMNAYKSPAPTNQTVASTITDPAQS